MIDIVCGVHDHDGAISCLQGKCVSRSFCSPPKVPFQMKNNAIIGNYTVNDHHPYRKEINKHKSLT